MVDITGCEQEERRAARLAAAMAEAEAEVARGDADAFVTRAVAAVVGPGAFGCRAGAWPELQRRAFAIGLRAGAAFARGEAEEQLLEVLGRELADTSRSVGELRESLKARHGILEAALLAVDAWDAADQRSIAQSKHWRGDGEEVRLVWDEFLSGHDARLLP